MSMFNVDAFLNSQANAPISTERLLVPPNTYPACVEKIDAKGGTIEKGDNAGKPWGRLDVTFEIQDQGVREFIGRSKVLMTYGVMLDLDEEGNLDTRKGRNTNLGKLYQALGMNEAGANPRMMVGRMAQIRVEHGSYQGVPREEIKAITKA